MYPILSIVSGTYNRLALLQAMLASARRSLPVGIPLNFIIVDGGSTDGTLEWLKTQSDVTLIEHGELRGAINAFTEGAHLSQAKYTLLANDDIEFLEDGILRALVYLESNPRCGAVAFADNRYEPHRYRAMNASALTEDGRQIFPVYAQVGLFRTWLGKELNWWRGLPEQAFKARTYGGDNLLTANILEAGYTVDAVDGVRVHDLMARDELRAINQQLVGEVDDPNRRISDEDAADYYRIFPVEQGPVARSTPRIMGNTQRNLRILYLPIYEPTESSYALQKKSKRGLREALTKLALVYEYDYVGRFHMEHATRDQIADELFHILTIFQPDLMLTQFHAADIVTPRMLGDLRLHHPRMVVVNWNGDAWEWGLLSKEMIELLRGVDLQLVVNPQVLSKYTEQGIPAAHWQIGYEVPDYPLPQAPAYDVIFMGNHYGEVRPETGLTLRGEFAHALRALESEGIQVGIYGRHWEKAGIQAQGDTTYDFALGEALMQAAKIVVGDNQFPDQKGYLSNRTFQAHSAGSFMLHQEVPTLEKLTGLVDGTHYVSFTDFADMQAKIRHYLSKPRVRARIAKAGQAYVLEHHSFDARVKQLFTELLPKARRQLGNTLTLRYIGPRDDPFGLRGPATGTQYTVNPRAPLVVDKKDGEQIIHDTNLWQVITAVQMEGLR